MATIIEEILHEKLHFLCSDPPLTRNLQTTVPYELPIFFNIVFSGRYHVHQINEGTRNWNSQELEYALPTLKPERKQQ